jgi:hypothetical protein
MRRSIVSLATAACVGCAFAPQNVRTLAPPQAVATLDRRAPYLKVHLKNGDVYVLSRWTVDESARTVSGTGQAQGPDRRSRPRSEHTVHLDEVALFEANLVPQSESLMARTVVIGVSSLVTIGCAATLFKACFGSCPTFYTGTGGAELLEAEGFSTSISPTLEQTDVDALYRSTVRGPRFEVQVRNEALETQVVRHAHVLAAPRPPNGRIVATQAGEFREAFHVRPPVSCAAPEGDCLAAVSAPDGHERTSRTDGRDLATRETIDLVFDDGAPDPGSHGARGLVIGTRQTLLTTYLLYQTLAYMGTAASAWMAQLERGGPELVDRAHAIRDLLGGIEVLVPDGAGGWTSAGEIHEVGPLAADVKIVPLPPGARAGRIRLRLTRGHWRLDYLAMARLGGIVAPVRLPPVEVRRRGSVVAAFGEGPLVTAPGDAYTLVYQLPDPPEGQELFMESRGYYLEWIRQEWLAEESPEKVLQMLFDPRQALVDLAPAFKAQEEAGERAFWSSRVPTR